MKAKIEPLLPSNLQNPTETILLALWLLCSSDTITSVAYRFNRTNDQCLDEFKAFCKAIHAEIGGEFIRWPCNAQQYSDVINQFNEITAEDGLILPNICGIIGCIDVAQQSVDRTSSLAENQNPLTKIQCVCDANGRFLDCFVRVNVHGGSNAEMFLSSPLHDHLEKDEKLAAGHHLIGDQTYPLCRYLMVPYKDRNSRLTAGQLGFNRNIATRRVRIDDSLRTIVDRFVRLSHLHSLPELQPFIDVVFALNNCCTNAEIMMAATNDKTIWPRIIGGVDAAEAANMSTKRRIMYEDVDVDEATLTKRDEIMLRVQQQPMPK